MFKACAGTSDTGPLLAMFYAHFLHLDCEDAAGARGIYERALQRWAGLRYLWEGAIHFEEHCLGPQRAGARAVGPFCRLFKAGQIEVQ